MSSFEKVTCLDLDVLVSAFIRQAGIELDKAEGDGERSLTQMKRKLTTITSIYKGLLHTLKVLGDASGDDDFRKQVGQRKDFASLEIRAIDLAERLVSRITGSQIDELNDEVSVLGIKIPYSRTYWGK